MLKKLLDFFFPQKCLGCGKEKEILCRECLKEINYSSLPEDNNIFSVAAYGDLFVQRAIWLLKYHKVKNAAEPLAELIYQRLFSGQAVNCPINQIAGKGETFLGSQGLTLKSDLPNWLLIPIPLSPKRLRERGFNQSELIAKHLSDKINRAQNYETNRDTKPPTMSVTVATNVLYKIRHTDTQVSIKDKKQRLTNLAGSFAAKNIHLIKNKDIIIIDDVCTTGATANEATKILKKSGAKKVIAIVVARG